MKGVFSLQMKNSTSRRQTLLIEIANAITHGVGAALAIAGLVILIVRAVHTGSPAHEMSTFYTVLAEEPQRIGFEQNLDVLLVLYTLLHDF